MRKRAQAQPDARPRVRPRQHLLALCTPVDKTLRPRLPASPEIHELIAVTRGGSPYDLGNCVLTHRACNNWIGNRTPDELARDTREKPTIQTTTLIDW